MPITNKNDLDSIATEKGFSSWEEMCSMVACFPMSTETQRLKFDTWKKTDGTKRGLLSLKKELKIVDC